MAKHLSHILKRKTANLGICKDDKNPPEEANARIKAKRSRRRQAFHHRQEGAGDDNVATPACHRVHRRAECSHFDGEQLGADPAEGCDAAGVESNVHDDRHQNEDASPVDGCSFEGEVLVDGDEVERDGGYDEGHGHAEESDEKDLATASTVDDYHVDEGEDEVCCSHDDGDGRRFVEADEREQCSGIVHQGIEPAQLADRHDGTATDKRSKVRWDAVELLILPP